MLMAKRENGEKVLATSDLENTKDFICRFCGQRVVLKKGKIKSPHFAHKEKCECDYNEQLKEKCGGESELHYKWKSKIKKEMEQLSYVKEILLEERIGNRIADIVVIFNDNIDKINDGEEDWISKDIVESRRLIIEIQLSKIPLQKVIERTKDYIKQKEYSEENITWLFGEKHKSMMGEYCRYITKDLTHYEYNKKENMEIELSVANKDETYGEWDIFTFYGYGVSRLVNLKERLEIKTLKSGLKKINLFSKKYRRDVGEDGTLATLCTLMQEGKECDDEIRLLKCRKEYVKQRGNYSKRYGVSNKTIDAIVKEFYESKEDFFERPYNTDEYAIFSYWVEDLFWKDDENIRQESRQKINKVLEVAQTIERVEAIENNDTCKYIVDK